MSWKTISAEILVNDYHVTVNKNHVQLPDGAMIPDFYTVTIPDAAMIAATTTDGKILLKRELVEETGYTSDDWTYFGPTWESTSKLTNRMHLFLAKNCTRVADQKLDENEHLEVFQVDLKEAVDMVMDGRINANSTAHLILKASRICGVI